MPAEAGTTPNFTTSLPPAGTSFPLLVTGLQYTDKKVIDGAITAGTLTIQSVSSGTPTFELKIPSINLDAPGLVGNSATVILTGDSTARISIGPISALTYASLGTWRFFDKSGVNGWDGAFLTGYQTQTGHVPTAGSASYLGVKGPTAGGPKAGGVTGLVWFPPDSGGTVASAGVGGDASLNINFATGAVTGQLSNMTVGTASGSVPWNTVDLSGTLSGASVSGTTSTTGLPAGSSALSQGFSSSATGTLKGGLFGPNANEVGAVWTLTDPTAVGKAAVGVVGATRQ